MHRAPANPSSICVSYVYPVVESILPPWLTKVQCDDNDKLFSLPYKHFPTCSCICNFIFYDNKKFVTEIEVINGKYICFFKLYNEILFIYICM